MLAQLINFGIFFFIFKKFIAKPFSEFLHKEEKNEKDKQLLAEKVKKQEEVFAKKQAEMKEKMRQEMDAAIKKAKESAERVREELILTAKKDADEIIIKAKKQLDEERTMMQGEMKGKISELSVFIIEQALKDYLDRDARTVLTKYILKNLNRAITSHEN